MAMIPSIARLVPLVWSSVSWFLMRARVSDLNRKKIESQCLLGSGMEGVINQVVRELLEKWVLEINTSVDIPSGGRHKKS
jgi:NAD(P)H-hydrate repair Nnr-like enzyme with NAD(P)H-hydrate epimerase domain